MKRLRSLVLTAATIILCSSYSFTQQLSSKVLLTIDDTPITVDEFKSIYLKNNTSSSSVDRVAMEDYLKLGYSKNWINQRLKSIEVRKELTDEWEERGVKKGQEFATLTDIITKGWSGKTVKEYKQHKNLKKENLRDNMTNLELVLNMLAEASTKEISKEKKPKNFDENKVIAKQGGDIAGNTRKAIEAKTGKQNLSQQNAQALKTVNKKSLNPPKK